MTRFLYGLIKDLQNKIHNLVELLERTNIHPDLASDYALQVRGKLEQAQKKLSAMAADKSLLNPKWLYNNLKKYRGLAREVQLIESFPLQVIVHYGEADHYLSNLGKWICKQIGYPLSPPIISTISNEYYWAYPGFRIIALPLGEEFLLLGLPDLYHELAHFLFAEYRGFLVGEFFTDLNKYIDSEQQRARDEAREEPYLTLFDKIKSEWKEKWIIEFSCDMIATYLVGPAYGWGNLKLSANSLSRFDVFGPSMEDFPGVEHPSDETRMRGIFAMLRQLKLENEINNIDEKW